MFKIHSQTFRVTGIAFGLTIMVSAQTPPPAPAARGGAPAQGAAAPGGRGPVAPLPALVPMFDKNNDKRLNAEERKAAVEYLATLNRRGAPAGPTPAPGRKLTPADVKSYGNESIYDPKVLRTLFLEFDTPNWELEMAGFNNTDVDMQAKLTVDGKVYPDVGVHYRGASSFGTVPTGWKRSINIAMDFAHKKQTLGGYATLNLLNAHNDPTFLRSALYQYIVGQYMPAPKVNFVRLVINGESWGIYANSEQFNSDSAKKWFGEEKGNRWKVQGSPGGRGGLGYLGEDPEPYKRIYIMKSKDNPKAWADLVNLTKVLTETPLDKLEAAVSPILDLDGVLRWLALDKALMNSDGYWVRMSDYNIFQDSKGKFHIISHDANETLREPEGGPRGAPAGSTPIGPQTGVALEPFAGDYDTAKVLMNRLLAVPSLRAKYLSYMRDIAEKWLDWNRTGLIAEQYRALIAEDVIADTRKLYSTESFKRSFLEDFKDAPPSGVGGPGIPALGLKNFFDQRRTYLLNHPDVKGAPKL